MKFEIIKKINNDSDKIRLIVEGPEESLDMKYILNVLSHIDNNTNELIAKKDNQIYIVNISEISMIYSDDRVNYIISKNERYRINCRLYELEKMLKDKFIRISNSYIVNMDYIKYFDCSVLGELVVVMKDDSKEYVSKRRIKDIMKLLKNKGGK